MNAEEPEGNTAFYDLSSDRCETGAKAMGKPLERGK